MDVHVVVGGQFGSEGKGHFVAQLAKRLTETDAAPLVIRTGGPNAGHTVVDDQGREWKLRQIPTAAVSVPESPVALAAGGEIDNEVLDHEVYMLEIAGIPVLDRLTVDAQATLLESHHKNQEGSLVERIGSTGKGIGAARADRIMRSAGLYGGSGDVAKLAADWINDTDRPIILEATQGYGLGLHAGFYPYCTSRDVRAIDVLAECGISPWQHGVDRVVVWVVFRPYPIRVAGDSGPLADETSWEDLGFPPERTTVTQKIRRVGHWNTKLARSALTANGYPAENRNSSRVRAVMMFADYIHPGLKNLTSFQQIPDDAFFRISWLEKELDIVFSGFGTSPSTFCWETEI